MVIRVGVIGQPVGQSLSPRIHNRWFEELGIDGRYEAVEASPDSFDRTVMRLRNEGWTGLNVTIPHKGAALGIADERSEEAEAIGAANLLRFVTGRIIAENTDHIGFARALKGLGTHTEPRHAIVLGAGGAAGAILYALRKAERVTLLNRTKTRADALAQNFENVRTASWDDRQELIGTAPDLLVNTTSLGMAGEPPLDIAFKRHVPAFVVDIVYKPRRTPLLQQAKAAGARVQNGLAMLVHQAAPSFEAWTGTRPPDVAGTIKAIEAEAE